MKVETLATPELGDRSYVVHDGSLAVVVDPQRDLDRMEALLERAGVHVGLVVETHVHNDYLTGGYELARRTGAQYAVAAAEQVGFDRTPVAGGDTLSIGGLTVEVLATPGHTDTHLAYVVRETSDESVPGALFSGGSLLYGSVGRTDLIDPARTAELAAAQHRSARLLGTLPGSTLVYPTHGFGSFCSGGETLIRDTSTIAQELVYSDALVEPDEREFVRRLVAGLGSYPSYYAHMAGENRRGPSAAELAAPGRLAGRSLAGSLAAGAWVVDLRDRVAYAAEHLSGTVNVEMSDQFATYVGWALPWGEPLIVLATDVAGLDRARRQLSRIGLRPAEALLQEASSDPEVSALAGGSYRRADFVELSSARAADPDVVVLDVRDALERSQRHVRGSIHIPLDQVAARLDELPQTGPVWVHCLSGYRASIAASLLDRAGREVVHVDDHLDRAGSLGLLSEA